MKTRILHMKMWQDEFMAELKPIHKLLFIYYIANPNIGLTGMYEITDRQVSFDTGLNKEQITEAKEIFEKAGKILFKDGWVYVVKAQELNGFRGEKLDPAIKKEKESFPEDVLNYFNTLSEKSDTVSLRYRYTSDTSINHKSEIINQKEGGVRGEQTKLTATLAYLEDLPPEDLDNFKAKYQANESQIRSKAVQLANYCKGHGKSYKDYRAMLNNALAKDFGERKTTYQPPPDPIELSPEKQLAAQAKLDEIRAKFKHRM